MRVNFSIDSAATRVSHTTVLPMEMRTTRRPSPSRQRSRTNKISKIVSKSIRPRQPTIQQMILIMLRNNLGSRIWPLLVHRRRPPHGLVQSYQRLTHTTHNEFICSSPPQPQPRRVCNLQHSHSMPYPCPMSRQITKTCLRWKHIETTKGFSSCRVW